MRSVLKFSTRGNFYHTAGAQKYLAAKLGDWETKSFAHHQSLSIPLCTLEFLMDAGFEMGAGQSVLLHPRSLHACGWACGGGSGST